ncbi:hypothetical protein V8C35DRAFT_310935 [Trichoderma chlorosporum]
MERTSKLARLTLVSKYYPVANYSYPRSEGARTPYNSRRSSNESEDKRTSLGSSPASAAASASPSPLSPPPGLIDDRTDSEASVDDEDFRYHAHGDELWDSFLESGLHIRQSRKERAAAMASVAAPGCFPPMVPEKDYPALIPSPQQVRRRPLPPGHRSQECSWPLSDGQPRAASPTYSAFPKIVSMPSGRCSRQSSSSQLSTTCCADAPCSPQFAPPIPPRPAASQHRSASPHPRVFSPASFMVFQHPGSSHGSRPSTPLDYHFPPPSPPPTAPLPALPPLSARPPHPFIATTQPSNLGHIEAAPAQVLRPYGSTAQPRPKPVQEPLPISVFEYDTDSDSDDDGESSSTGSPTLSFFRFHRRSQSPNTMDGILTRRRGSASKTPVQQSFVDAATVAKDRRRRKRTNTMDSLPLVSKQADVLSRMLGRRSR